MYLDRPAESLISLLKMREISKRNRWRSRPLRISDLGSHTWKASCRMSSPWTSRFSAKPDRRKHHIRGWRLKRICGKFVCTSLCYILRTKCLHKQEWAVFMIHAFQIQNGAPFVWGTMHCIYCILRFCTIKLKSTYTTGTICSNKTIILCLLYAHPH